MRHDNFDVEPISPVIGARVHGVDLSEGLSEPRFASVRDAWIKHKVLAFPDQTLTHAQFEDFAAKFGEPYVLPLGPGREGNSAVHELRADETSKHAFGETWHSDMSPEERPPMGTMLRLVQIPPHGGGDTMFADMYAAYDSLSDRLKSLLDGLTARHDSSVFARKYGIAQDMPAAVHPVVRTHPVSGRKCLYVNTRFTSRIDEMKETESRAVLDFLFRHVAETPDFQLRFRWSLNTLLLWDNRCTQHCAIFDYWPHTRVGYRIMIRGDKPY